MYRLFIRGITGHNHTENYNCEWIDFNKNSYYKRLQRKRPKDRPRLHHSKLTGFSILELPHISWLSLVEGHFIQRIKPLFYYVWGKESPFNNNLFPFHLATLNLEQNEIEISKESLIAIFTKEFKIKELAPIIDQLFDHKFIHEREWGSCMVAPLSSHLSCNFDSSRAHTHSISFNNLEFSIEEAWAKVSFLEIGMKNRHASEISSLISNTAKIRKDKYDAREFSSIRYCIDFESKLIPLIHHLLNHFMFLEARALLNHCRRLVLGRDMPAKEEQEKKDLFTGNSNSMIGGPLSEVCGIGDTTCFAAMLPFTPTLIETGCLYPRNATSSYQVYGEVKLK